MRLTDSPISRRALAGLLLASAMPAGPALAAARSLRGSVVYRERLVLPPGAVVEVRLLDISLADAPARTIAETRVYGRRLPARWILRYDTRQIEPRHSYALQARILDGDRLLFVTTERHSVLAGGRDATTLRMERVGRPEQAPPAAPFGNWRLAQLGGTAAQAGTESTLDVSADGKVSGRGGCNGFGGSITVRGQAIRFSRLVSTMMACTPEVMSQERRLLDGLGTVRRWELQPDSGLLALLDGRGRTIMTFARK